MCNAKPIDQGTSLLKRQIYIVCIQCSACMYVCVPEESTKSHYRWLWVTCGLLGIDPQTSRRTESVLNLWTTSPAWNIIFMHWVYRGKVICLDSLSYCLGLFASQFYAIMTPTPHHRLLCTAPFAPPAELVFGFFQDEIAKHIASVCGPTGTSILL